MKKKLIFVHLFFVVISLGIKHYRPSESGLIWNMFLALAALNFSVFVYYSKRKVLRLLMVFLWLFFYPNTFYMLTDVVHMHFASTILWDQQSMILYMLYMPSILFGLLCGVESVATIFNSFKISQYYVRLFLISVLSFVSSFAIHIGRYARLNSWDIFTRPLTVVHEIVDVISWNAFYFVVGFTCIQIMCLIFLDKENLK